MASPLLFVTGFGPFEEVDVNPSGALARALGVAAPAGIEVRATELPVSFRRATEELERALAGTPRPPDAFLALGVHRGAFFRLERRARAQLRSGRPDVDGADARTVGPGDGEDLATSLDLGMLEAALLAAGAPEVRVSDDAGGYLCEHVYRHALTRARELGVPALFLHVPPISSMDVDAQLPILHAVASEVGRQVTTRVSV